MMSFVCLDSICLCLSRIHAATILMTTVAGGMKHLWRSCQVSIMASKLLSVLILAAGFALLAPAFVSGPWEGTGRAPSLQDLRTTIFVYPGSRRFQLSMWKRFCVRGRVSMPQMLSSPHAEAPSCCHCPKSEASRAPQRLHARHGLPSRSPWTLWSCSSALQSQHLSFVVTFDAYVC